MLHDTFFQLHGHHRMKNQDESKPNAKQQLSSVVADGRVAPFTMLPN